MPGTGRSEVIFVAAMMILILILSVAAVLVFFRTYKKEMREKELREQAKNSASEATGVESTMQNNQ